ncbi:MAG: hypothetical protein FWF28_10630 [Micrococcales bacterium]|nr:hypothetical protein [Micrococcales bacterium]
MLDGIGAVKEQFPAESVGDEHGIVNRLTPDCEIENPTIAPTIGVPDEPTTWADAVTVSPLVRAVGVTDQDDTSAGVGGGVGVGAPVGANTNCTGSETEPPTVAVTGTVSAVASVTVTLATPVASVLTVADASRALPPTLNVTGTFADGATQPDTTVAVTVQDDDPSATTVPPAVGLAASPTCGGSKAPV